MSIHTIVRQLIDDAARCGFVLVRGSDLMKRHDDSVGAFIGDYDDHMRFLDWCEFAVGYDPEVCFSNVRSWEDKHVHEKAWALFEQWRAWQAD